MTQSVFAQIRSVLERLLPPLPAEPLFAGAPSDLNGRSDAGEERLPERDESFYWAWCTHGHW